MNNKTNNYSQKDARDSHAGIERICAFLFAFSGLIITRSLINFDVQRSSCDSRFDLAKVITATNVLNF